MVDQYQSHQVSWCRPSSWCPLWWPWLSHPQGACWAECWSGSPVGPVLSSAPRLWLHRNREWGPELLECNREGFFWKTTAQPDRERKTFYPGCDPSSYLFSPAEVWGKRHFSLCHSWPEPEYPSLREQWGCFPPSKRSTEKNYMQKKLFHYGMFLLLLDNNHWQMQLTKESEETESWQDCLFLFTWIGEGFSHPISKIPIRSSRFRQ